MGGRRLACEDEGAGRGGSERGWLLWWPAAGRRAVRAAFRRSAGEERAARGLRSGAGLDDTTRAPSGPRSSPGRACCGPGGGRRLGRWEPGHMAGAGWLWRRMAAARPMATCQVASRGWRGAEMEGSGGKQGGRKGRPKLVGETSIYSKGARVRGLGGVSGPSDRDRALRTERGTRWLQVGCVECLELRRERNRATRWQFRRPKRPTIKPTISRL